MLNIFYRTVQCIAANQLKIYRKFTNYICYNFLEFRENGINIYKTISTLFKNAKFSAHIYHLTERVFIKMHKTFKNMTKSIETIVIKL